MFLSEAVRECQRTTGQIIHRDVPNRWWSYELVAGVHEFIEWPAGIRWEGLSLDDAFSDRWNFIDTTAWVLKPCKCGGVAEFFPRAGEIVMVGCSRCERRMADKSASSVVCRWNSHG